MRRRVLLLGATGSIGAQTLEVVAAYPERFELVGLAANADVHGLLDAAAAHGVVDLALADADAAARARRERPDARVRDGARGVEELAGLDADIVVNGITGAQGLGPTLAALAAGTPVALANKESLVVGGPLVTAAAAQAGGVERHLVPVDSEHSALAQCLRGGRREEVARLVLTASGGPFRGRRRAELEGVTAEQALAHPTWDMGPVVTVNSATLMNKGLELIEAHLLFEVAWDDLAAVAHPQSIVHSMVEFHDGSTLAQLSPPDMRLPIQLALGWPARLDGAFARMDWTRRQTLEFEPIDRDAFPALDLAEAAGRAGGSAPAALNAANEEAVASFLAGSLGFLQIAAVVADVLAEHERRFPGTPRGVEDVLHVDAWARRAAAERMRALGVPGGGVAAGVGAPGRAPEGRRSPNEPDRRHR